MTSKSLNHNVKECECFDCKLLKGHFDTLDMQAAIFDWSIYMLLAVIALLVLFLVARGSLPFIGAGLVIFVLAFIGQRHHKQPK